MKTSEIINIYETLQTECHKAYAEDSIAMKKWHERQRQLKTMDHSMFEDEAYIAFKNAREKMQNADKAFTAFMNHDWK